MKILDKIIVSPTPPTSKNVAWFDGKGIKIPNQGKWENTGGSGESTSIMINVTYEELVRLRNEGKLTPGAKYRMTDYETTCTWANTQVAGHPFDLVLTALDNKTLDEKCSAIWSERDTDGYFANSNLPAWDVRYCLDNDKGRFDWAQLGGTIVKISAYDAPFTFDGMYIGETFEIGGVEYCVWGAYLDGEMEFPFLTTSLNLSVGDEVYFSNTGESIDGTGSVVDTFEQVEGKGVIYRLIDESENSVPYDFKNIMFMHPLTEGVLDGENGTETFCYTFSCIQDDLTIEDQSVKEPYNCNNNKFSLYCHDNVFLTHSGKGCYFNTFGNECSFNTFGDGCYSNTFGDGCYSNTFGNTCHSITFGDGCHSNTFGNECRSITFGNKCYSNTFGNECRFITFGNTCHSITFGNNCYSITFGNTCHSITFGNNCYSITFGNNCYSITFGNGCYSNTFGNNCRKVGFTKRGSFDPKQDCIDGCFNNYIEDGVTNTILWLGPYNESTEIKNVKVTSGVRSEGSTQGVTLDNPMDAPQLVVLLRTGFNHVCYFDNLLNVE